MRTSMTEVLDLALTQAIERYTEMNHDEVHEAITIEWPEQLATLLTEFLFKTTCSCCGGIPDLVEFERDSGESYYIQPFCSCETRSLPSFEDNT